MHAALDEHYRQHPTAKPSLVDVALALGAQDGSELVSQRALVTAAAQELLARHPMPTTCCYGRKRKRSRSAGVHEGMLASRAASCRRRRRLPSSCRASARTDIRSFASSTRSCRCCRAHRHRLRQREQRHGSSGCHDRRERFESTLKGLACPSSRAALNTFTRQSVRQEPPQVHVNTVNFGQTATDPNNHRRAQTLEEGVEIIATMATIEPEGPTGGFFDGHRSLAW